MPTYEVTAPDGSVFDVTAPEGASQAQVMAYARANFKKAAPKPMMGQAESALTGFGGVVNNLTGRVVDGLDALGLASDKLKSDRAALDAEFADAMPRTQTAGRLVGEVIPTLATAPLKGGMAAQGALSGAMLSDDDTLGGVAKDAAVGAATSLGVGKVLQAGAALAKPTVSAGAKALRDAGVLMTPGQIAGLAEEGATGLKKVGAKFARGVEERLAGFTIIGDVINTARDRSTITFNAAKLNGALSAIGGKMPDTVKAGHEAVRYVGDKLSEGYNALLPKLSATVDGRFAVGLRQAQRSTATLPADKQAQFSKIIADAFGNRAQSGTLTGKALKDAEEKLRDQATAYKSSGDVDQRRMGQAVGKVLDEFRALVERSNPQFRGQLQKLNKGWRQLAIIEDAAGGAGNTTGMFTPKGYAAAARKADSSVRKRATARGTTPDQVLNDAAARALPNSTPDSGTAGRASMAIGLGALGAGSVTVSPWVAALGVGALPHTLTGQKAINALLLGNRPKSVQAVARPLNALANYAPQLAVPATVHFND